MLLAINDDINGGYGFGNKFLYFNNLVQLASKNNMGYSCPVWSGCDIFDLELKKITDTPKYYLKFCLGEKYHEYKTVSTREIFKLKPIKQSDFFTDKIVCGIHIRETDFHAWMPESVTIGQKLEYYMKSIEETEKIIDGYFICTDDPNTEKIIKITDHLKSKQKTFMLGENTHDRNRFHNDFLNLLSCDYMISSPSTYCISSCMVGKKKKVIHSSDWLNYRCQNEDLFWVNLRKMNDEDYSIWKEI